MSGGPLNHFNTLTYHVGPTQWRDYTPGEGDWSAKLTAFSMYVVSLLNNDG